MSEQMTREELRIALLSALSGHSLVLSGWSVTDDVMEVVDDYIDQVRAASEQQASYLKLANDSAESLLVQRDQARAAIEHVRELTQALQAYGPGELIPGHSVYRTLRFILDTADQEARDV